MSKYQKLCLLALQAAQLHLSLEKIAIRSIGVNDILYSRLQITLKRSERRVIRRQLLAGLSPWIPQRQHLQFLQVHQLEVIDEPQSISSELGRIPENWHIKVFRDQDNHQTQVYSYENRSSAWSAFDDFTKDGSELGGYLRWVLYRRNHEILEMYTQE
jgi:hypothetical protein